MYIIRELAGKQFEERYEPFHAFLIKTWATI